MKKLVATVFLLSLVSTQVLAENDHKLEATSSSRWLKVSGDPEFALFGVFIAKGEFKISEELSVLVNGGYIDPRISIKPTLNSAQFGNDGLVGVKFGGGLRWYPFGGCMKGIFIQDIVDSDVLWTYSGKAFDFFPGASVGPVVWTIFNSIQVGYSWVTEIGFFADVALGINATATLVGLPADKIPFSFYEMPGVHPMNRIEGRIAVGWAF